MIGSLPKVLKMTKYLESEIRQQEPTIKRGKKMSMIRRKERKDQGYHVQSNSRS